MNWLSPDMVSSLATICSVLSWVIAIPILVWLERRTVRQRRRKPVPSEIFQRAWTSHAGSFVSVMRTLGKNGTNTAMQSLEDHLKRDFPLHWKSILTRAGILVTLLSEHPGIFLHWINPAGDPAHFFHPAVLAAVAALPLSCSKYPKFDKLVFLNLMERAAAGIDAGERTPEAEGRSAVNIVLVAITWAMQRITQLRVRLIVPVSPDIFRRAWNEIDESFLSLATLQADEQKKAENTIEYRLEQRYPLHSKAITRRGIGLACIVHSYPALFAQWIQKEHGNDRFHLAVYSTAATMPLRFPGLFDSLTFFDLVGRATVRDGTQMEMKEPAP